MQRTREGIEIIGEEKEAAEKWKRLWLSLCVISHTTLRQALWLLLSAVVAHAHKNIHFSCLTNEALIYFASVRSFVRRRRLRLLCLVVQLPERLLPLSDLIYATGYQLVLYGEITFLFFFFFFVIFLVLVFIFFFYLSLCLKIDLDAPTSLVYWPQSPDNIIDTEE